MSANIAFYVHHHGSGHLMRSLAISAHLNGCRIRFLGSGLAPFAALVPPSIECVHLPLDTPTADDPYYRAGPPVEGLHYAPLNVAGQRQRTTQLTDFFARHWPLLLVVDVSVEVALLARLSGIPTIVVKQHGHRRDLAHQLAYQGAQCVLAPYPPLLQQNEAPWLADKIVYTGGFSRYRPGEPVSSVERPDHLAVLVGSGGTSLTPSFVAHLARQVPHWRVEVVGRLAGEKSHNWPGNVVTHGQLSDPRAVLDRCQVVLGNGGHNTVMEMATLDKRFIVVPEPRPFQEQAVKAQLLANLGLASVVEPQALYQTDWPALLSRTAVSSPLWTGIVEAQAAGRAAELIRHTYVSLYSKQAAKT